MVERLMGKVRSIWDMGLAVVFLILVAGPMLKIYSGQLVRDLHVMGYLCKSTIRTLQGKD